MSLGYNEEEILKIVAIAPEIFRYTPEAIKSILNTIEVSKEELVNSASNMQSIVDEEKNQRKR